ncbi:phosphate-repressible phosphate permease [Rhizodiscina lignyota]|uniref:Phosphate transporter n=1 Tax=Rhizodiscina lignyota TaxID=1504668 RepID=A0A9P4I8Q6_9PEZI|nr:phosphate-repressible phosphate permease [Rhizodiscina lignyota]
MAYLHQYDYIFAIGIIFAALDAWNIGANDVANSFATSVSSRSLTMKQAMCIASVMEFVGAMSVGARVADTIRTKVIDVSQFENEPSILMLGMTCAVIGSSVYLTIATKLGLPVSTTHSIMGGVIGVGIATLGANGVHWGWDGVAQVFAAWAIAPGIAGCFGAIVFLITKFGVMKRSNPIRNAFISAPFYFFLTAALLAMLIVWKGASSKIDLDDGGIAGTIVGTGAVVSLLSILFLLPYVYRKLFKDDWQLKWYHFVLGPLLLRRPDPPPRPENVADVVDYYAGHLTRDELDAMRASQAGVPPDPEKNGPQHVGPVSDVSSDEAQSHGRAPVLHGKAPKDSSQNIPPRPTGPWYRPAVAWWLFQRIVFRGVEKDVVGSQSHDRSFLAKNIEDMHARASHFDNKAEYMYSFLQVLTASTSSFAHGANDISNAVGPFATVYLIWSTGELNNKTPVPSWSLAFCGGCLVIGLWTYGYNIMRNLGNRITLHSPSRGFSMELGSAITVVMATQLALPVSTTQCITGATVGVGLCNGDWRTINWRMVAWIYGGWIITLPCAGILSGCIMGIIINAPQWGNAL